MLTNIREKNGSSKRENEDRFMSPFIVGFGVEFH